MTKHEFHIALVLLALITAGVVGHQLLNTDTGKTRNDCTLALYFSSYDGCNSSEQIEVITSQKFKERIQTAFTPEKNTLILDIEERMEHYERTPHFKSTGGREAMHECEQNEHATDR
jgi:hypothetical protein